MTIPHRYKTLANKTKILCLLAGIFLISLLIPIALRLCNFIDYEYLTPPSRLGCTLVLKHKSCQVYFTLFFILTIGLILIFLITYLILHYNFKTMINTTAEIETLKRGALIITSLEAGTYFCGYSPLAVVYMVMWINPGLTRDLEPPYTLVLDFFIRFMPHLNACLLPLFLVSGNTMDRLKEAASITIKSFRKYDITAKYTTNVSENRENVNVIITKRNSI